MDVGVRSSSIMRSSLRSISSRWRRIGKRLLAEVMADEEGPILRLGGWVRMGPKWQSGLNSALFALRVGEALEETHSSLSHIVRPYPLYRVPEIVTRGRFPDGGASDSTWRTQRARP